MHRIHLKTKYCDELSSLMTFGRYANGRTAIEFYGQSGSPLCRATINMPGEKLADDEVVLKNYSENEGLLECMIDHGLVEDTGRRVTLDYCEAAIVKLTPLALEGK